MTFAANYRGTRRPFTVTFRASHCRLYGIVYVNAIDSDLPLLSLSTWLLGIWIMQVTISYGNRDNDDLLQYFGFVEENCAFDRFVVEDPVATLRAARSSNLVVLDPTLSQRLDSLSTSAGNGKGKEAAAVVVNKGALNSWQFGALSSLCGKDNGSARNSSVEDTLTDPVARSALTALLLAEKLRLQEAKRNYLTRKEGAGSASDDDRLCLVNLFLTEKISVIDSVLSRI